MAICVKIRGKFGNNLFGISTGYAHSIRNKTNLLLDNSTDYQTNNWYSNLGMVFDHNLILGTIEAQTYTEQNTHFSEIPMNDNLILDGFFQSDKYFKDYYQEVKDLLKIKKCLIEKVKSTYDITNSCVVHVRRYNNVPNIPSLDISYYHQAMSLVKNCKYYICSNDVEWCENNFVGHIITRGSWVDDFVLMTLCKNNILSNSSFGWWGAWLNENKKQTVIAPKEWCLLDSRNDRICDNWTSI